MKINTTARHYDLTPALKEYAEGKIEHLSTFFEHLDSAQAHAIFALEKYRHFFEVTLHSDGRDFIAHDTSEDMYASVDSVVDKLERQIMKHKGKLYNKKRPKLSELPVDLGPEEADEEEDHEGEVSAADPLEFPRLTRGEAVAKLRTNGDEYSIFSDRTTRRVTVLFKREDGTIGLIESKE